MVYRVNLDLEDFAVVQVQRETKVNRHLPEISQLVKKESPVLMVLEDHLGHLDHKDHVVVRVAKASVVHT